MKKIIITKIMNYIKKKTNYSKTELEKIQYGIVSIYLTISKFLVISFICALLGIFKEMLIFTTLFNVLRLTAFGLHASKSWMCWISTTLIFIIIPCGCMLMSLNNHIKIIICILCVIFMFKNAPADTKKRPIVSTKRRLMYKIISTLFAIIFSVFAIITDNNFLSNCLIFALILENILISSITYKLFKLPYNNYITFLKEHPDFNK